MFPNHNERKLGLVAGLLAGLAAGGVGAGAGAGEVSTATKEALGKFGLKQAGIVLVLETESDVHGKIGEARLLYQERSNAIARRRSTLSEKEYQATIKELNTEVTQFRTEMNSTTQMMSRLPKYRGRFVNNLVAGQYAELNQYKNQLQWEINQRTTFLNQLKRQPFDPKARLRADTEVRDKEDALHQISLDTRQLVDTITEKYAGLAKDPAVKKLMGAIGKESGTKPMLGPSRQFRLDLKLLEKLEKGDSSGDTGNATAKAGRKTHRAGKAKRSTKAVTGQGNSDSPF